LDFHGWFTCRHTVTLSANAAAAQRNRGLSHHSEALLALQQQRRRVVGDVQHVFDLARHLARRFLGGRPVGVPDLMNETNCRLQKKLDALWRAPDVQLQPFGRGFARRRAAGGGA
jgi:hypothetical protein